MRAAYVLGPGLDARALIPFQQPTVASQPLASEHNADPPDALLIFGGDGTLHHQLDFLVRTLTPLLVVPCGSGNDFAKAIGLHSRTDAIELWRRFCVSKAQLRTLDVGAITLLGDNSQPLGREIYFCNVAGVGLDAAANRRANAQPAWLRAHGGYFLAALAEILRSRPYSMKISTRDTNGNWNALLDETLSMAAVANSHRYGSGIQIAPRARLDDAKLDLCAIGEASRWRMLRLFPRVLAGQHLGLPEVKYLQTEQVRIETAEPMDIYADGEFIGQTPADIRVVPQAMRVITPA
jgi:diacylglycerol kinase (ATP)